MRTDALFYELFQAAPQTFFELLQITPTCPYRFESITVKMSEKRIDGVLEPSQAGERIYFAEVQAFPDEVIYWRVLREVATFFEQRPALKDNDWQALVLWLNKDDDPGYSTLLNLSRQPLPRLVSVDLLALLPKLQANALSLNVLRLLLAETEEDVRKNLQQWAQNIQQTPNLDQQTETRLLTILAQFVEQKFRSLTYKEISDMLRLTPLAETISGQELIKDERLAILSRQIQIRFQLSDELTEAIGQDLEKLDLPTLKLLLEEILRIESFEQLELWISEQVAA